MSLNAITFSYIYEENIAQHFKTVKGWGYVGGVGELMRGWGMCLGGEGEGQRVKECRIRVREFFLYKYPTVQYS
jgi:hypothetical protein